MRQGSALAGVIHIISISTDSRSALASKATPVGSTGAGRRIVGTLSSVPDVIEAALTGVSVDASVLQEIGRRRAVDDLAVRAIVVLPDWALGVGADAVSVGQAEGALALVVQRVIDFAQCAGWHCVAADGSREGIGWTGASIDVGVPDSAICAGNLRRKTDLVDQDFSSRAIAGFFSIIPLLARLASIDNTEETVPDCVEWALASPGVLNPLLSSCAGLLEPATVLDLNGSRSTRAFQGRDVPRSAIVTLDTSPSIPLEAGKASAFLDCGIEVLTSEALVDGETAVATPVASIRADTLVEDWIPDSAV